MDRRHARALGFVVAVKLVASIAVWRSGFRAVSDDDFARVAIAQAFAHAPKLDPSGTSWLPLPFWIYGSVMRALGASIDVARGTALGLGLLSATLVYAAASLATATRLGALLGACAAAAFLWSARLGVATVPELPTAALTLLALVTLMPRAVERWPHARLLGAGALVLATLSRYEPWFVAAFFVAICVVEAARASTPRRRSAQLLAATFASSGPLLWMAWNRAAHGDALHFVARVVAYKRALGADEDGTAFAALAAPLAILRDEPELSAGFFAALIALVALGRARALSAYARPAGAALLLMAGLAVAAMRDGAPTHHPERALLVVMLLMAVIAGDVVAQVGSFALSAPRPTRLALGVVGLACVGLAARQRLHEPRSTSIDREGALALGVEAARRLAPGERLLVAIDDDASWATIAGFGRVHDLVRDRDLDPRRPIGPSSFARAETLRTRLEQTGARGFVGRASETIMTAFGPPAVERGGQGLWLVR
jgi:hypothetical protein